MGWDKERKKLPRAPRKAGLRNIDIAGSALSDLGSTGATGSGEGLPDHDKWTAKTSATPMIGRSLRTSTSGRIGKGQTWADVLSRLFEERFEVLFGLISVALLILFIYNADGSGKLVSIRDWPPIILKWVITSILLTMVCIIMRPFVHKNR